MREIKQAISRPTVIYPRQSELVEDSDLWTKRRKVPGGWIVDSMHLSRGVLSSVFVSDPEHTWRLAPIVAAVVPNKEGS